MKLIYNYLTTNVINKKQYVGMHIGELDDSYLGSGTYLKKAFTKYGRVNFIKEILEICDNVEEAYLNEEKYIKEYNTLAPNGYNLSPAGGLNRPRCFSKETIEKIRKGNLGKKISEESKEKMRKPKHFKEEDLIKMAIRFTELNKNRKDVKLSEIHKMRISEGGKGKGMYGKHISEAQRLALKKPKSKEAKENMSLAHKNIGIIKCPHCDKEGKSGGMRRHHFNNCKHKIN